MASANSSVAVKAHEEEVAGVHATDDFDVESEISDVILEPICANDLYTKKQYMGMPAVYLAVGIIYGGQSAIIYPVYQLVLRAPQNYQNAVYRVIALFWSFKIFYGFLSDTVPIMGKRRKPYLMFGFFFSGLTTALQAIYVQTKETENHCFEKGVRIPIKLGDDCPAETDWSTVSIASDFDGNFLVGLMFLTNFFYMFADVAADGLAVEYAKREPPAQRGRIQSYNYVCRFTTTIMTILLTAFSLNTPIYGGDFQSGLALSAYLWILTIGQLVFVPMMVIMYEPKVEAKDLVSYGTKLKGAWQLLQNRAFSSLMVFNVLFNVFTNVGIVAGFGLAAFWVGASGMQYNFSAIFQYVALTLTVWINGKYFVTYSWRCLQSFSLITSTIMGLLSLIIIYDINRSPEFWIFTQVDTVILSMIGWLTSVWACNEMAPRGLEGTSLAIATTSMNAASTMANFFTNRIGGAFDLLNGQGSQIAHNFFNIEESQDQFAQNLYIVMVINLLGLCFMWLLPYQKAQARRRYQTWGSSIPYGFLGLGIIGVAMFYGTVTNLATLFCPCAPTWGGPGCQEGTCEYPVKE